MWTTLLRKTPVAYHSEQIQITAQRLFGLQRLLTTAVFAVVASSISGLSAQESSETQAGEDRPPVHDVRVSSFQEITPGETTVAEIEESLGQPLDQLMQGDSLTFVYKVGPFPRVEFVTQDDVVSTIVIHLAKPTTPNEVARELGLGDFAPATVVGETGEELGQVYPERGVVFSFPPEGGRKVSQLMLTTIAAESFVLRARGNRYGHERARADLDYAIELDSDNADAHWLKARVLAAAQRHQDALDEVNTAVRLNGAEPHYRLTRSALLFEMDQYKHALADAQHVVDHQDTPKSLQAQAESQLGNLLAEGPQRYFDKAMHHHLAAIGAAAPFATHPNSSERRAALRVLVDAHLAVANDITRGDWSKKAEAVPKWLRSANELVANAGDDHADYESLQLLVLCRALSSYVGMEGEIDPTELLAKTMRHGQRMIDETDDSIRKTELRWHLVQALFDAVRIERNREQTANVLKHGKLAIELIDVMAQGAPSTPRARYLVGRLHFYVGSAFAVDEDNHERAVHWYGKALSYFSSDLPTIHAHDRGHHGQRFISMGVSYWQMNSRDRAVALTRRGLELMQKAYEEGSLDKQALGIPYGNLAAMYRVLGRTTDAKRLAERAMEFESGPTTTRRR